MPSPKYSTIALVPPLTVKISATFKIISFGAVQPLSVPVNLTPISFGIFVLKGIPAITSTASAPPTPIAIIPIPPAFGVWLSVPIIIPPGKAYCSKTTWCIMPAPGPQKPMLNFSDADLKKSNTSLCALFATFKSLFAPS